MTEDQRVNFLKRAISPTEKTIICTQCGGLGKEEEWIGLACIGTKTCSKCNGKRVLIQTTWKLEHVEYEPLVSI